MPGITGATITPTGIPACASCAITRSRAWGEAVRGSNVRLISAFSDVMLNMTETRRFFARSASKSMSRTINALFVTMVTGWRQRASTMRMLRVMPRRFSSGW